MLVTVTTEVRRCYDCPHFINHPQEASCGLVPNGGWDYVISHRVAEKEIWEGCPLNKEVDHVDGSLKIAK